MSMKMKPKTTTPMSKKTETISNVPCRCSHRLMSRLFNLSQFFSFCFSLIVMTSEQSSNSIKETTDDTQDIEDIEDDEEPLVEVSYPERGTKRNK